MRSESSRMTNRRQNVVDHDLALAQWLVSSSADAGVGRRVGSYDLSDRRFDDGNVVLGRSAADSDAGDHLAVAGDRHAAAHRGVSTPGDGEEWIELRAW